MRDPQVVETPHLFPGACVDGRQDGPVVDTFYEPLGYGRVYLSRQMLRDSTRLFPHIVAELAEEMGFVRPEIHASMIQTRDEEIQAAHRDVAALEQANLNLARRLGETPPTPAPAPAAKPAARRGRAKAA